MNRRAAMAAVAAALCAPACSIAPKSFRQTDDPAPLVRARAVGLSRGLPDSVVIPSLLERLNDPDSVVRMTAHEELRQRTGMDFGYVAWGGPEDRAAAIAEWNRWWAEQSRRGTTVAATTESSRSLAPADFRRRGRSR
jgi:HEAT repeat protein